MARRSVEKYVKKDGSVSWRLRYITGYDERGNPIHRRKTVNGRKREAEAKLREQPWRNTWSAGVRLTGRGSPPPR